MTQNHERDHLERYSRGEIDRRALQVALDRELDFADVLRLLHKHELKLPRIRSAPETPGLRVLEAQLRRVAHG